MKRMRLRLRRVRRALGAPRDARGLLSGSPHIAAGGSPAPRLYSLLLPPSYFSQRG